MKVILIEPDEKLKISIEINIAKELNFEVVQRNNAEDTIAFLQILPDARIIITKDIIGKEHTASKIADYLIESGRTSVQVFIIGLQCKQSHDFIHKLEENILPQDLISKIKTINTIKGQSTIIAGHLSLPITSLKYIEIFPCDIFFKINKEDKMVFIKRFNKNDYVNIDEIHKYMEKGLKKFFIQENNFDTYLKHANLKFSEALNNQHSDNKSKEEIRKLILKQIKSIGINGHTIDLAASIIQDIDTQIQKKKGFDIILQVFNSNLVYPFQRSYMTSVFCKLICDQFAWTNHEHIYTLSIASIFCNSELSSKVESEIISQKQLTSSELHQERKDIIQEHAKIAADKLKDVKNLSPAIHQIVLQHHGNTTGQKFTFDLAEKMTPLISIFIVADNFSRLVLASTRATINATAYLNEIKMSYPHKNIESIVQKFKEILKSPS